VIGAVARTDDGVYEVRFDARPYLEQADEQDLLELVQAGFRDHHRAEYVAEWSARHVPELREMFDYLSHLEGSEDAPRFEVEMDGSAAYRYVEKERPHVVDRLARRPQVDDAAARRVAALEERRDP
jgi:hypothetical protein